MKTPPTGSSTTDCNDSPRLFQDLGPRQVVADFSGGTRSTDGGALLLRQADHHLGLSRTRAECFDDQRDARFVAHQLQQLLAQRSAGLALGYQDLNDHDPLRRDPLRAVACDKRDPLGQDRCFADHRGAALAAPATLHRLEWSNNQRTRGHKLPHDPPKVEACRLKLGVRCLPKHARELVVDLAAMGRLLHGAQEGRHFSAYDGDYCYLPLYAFVGDIPLRARPRDESNEVPRPRERERVADSSCRSEAKAEARVRVVGEKHSSAERTGVRCRNPLKQLSALNHQLPRQQHQLFPDAVN